MPTTDAESDTLLARRLHEAGAVDLPTLQRCLQRVREGRGADPALTLGLLLLREGLVAPAALERALPQPPPAASTSTPVAMGEYRIVRELARGGMGAVYEAEHEPTGARRALKTLLPVGLEGFVDEEERRRLEEEALALGRLDHPAIVRVHGGDFDAEPPYLVQDLLSGGTLGARLEGGPLPVARALEIARRLAEGLAHAHGQGVLHRDLKPDNVLFDERDQPKLVDFGLARRIDASLRLTVTGTILGTPGFMPPEQAKGEPTDERSDVYGLGAVLYATLTGRAPFVGATPISVLSQVLEKRPPAPSELRPEVSPQLDAVVLRALAKRPDDRFPDVRELAAALALDPTSGRRARRLLPAVALGALLAGAALFAGRGSPPEPAAPAQPERRTDAHVAAIETTYHIGWTKPKGTRFHTTIRTASNVRGPGVRTTNILTVTAQTTVEANDDTQLQLKGRVSRIQGWFSVPKSFDGPGAPADRMLRLDSHAPPKSGSTVSVLAGRLLAMVGSAVELRWTLADRGTHVLGFPRQVTLGARTIRLRERLSQQMALAGTFIPRPLPLDGRWDLPVPDYRERFHGAEMVFASSGRRYCELQRAGDEVVIEQRVELGPRWDHPQGISHIKHRLSGTIRYQDGYLRDSKTEIVMTWRRDGAPRRLDKEIRIENVLR